MTMAHLRITCPVPLPADLRYGVVDGRALRQLRRLRSGIETNVFAGLTVELHLCDAAMEEFQLLTK